MSSNRSTSSAEASPASQSAWLDGDEEPPTSDGSGLNSPDCFAFYDRDSRCWRTSQGSLLEEAWPKVAETWPRSGSMRSGTAYRRRPSVPRTSATASSLWPTPSSMTYNGGEPTLTPGMAKHWRRKRGNLMEAVAATLWPTP